MGSLFKAGNILVAALFLLTLTYVSAPVGVLTIDTNYFAWDANIQLSIIGLTQGQNYMMRIYDDRNDMNYWSGRIPSWASATSNVVDFNIIDNNYLLTKTVCDENVYSADSNVASSKPPTVATSDANGYYFTVPTIGAGCPGNAGEVDINVMVPKGITRGMKTIYVHQITLSESANTMTVTTSAAGSGIIFVTPFLQVYRNDGQPPVGRSGNILRPYGARDTNIMVTGVGFVQDENVTLKWYNFPRTGAAIDLNMADDGNGSVYYVHPSDGNCSLRQRPLAGLGFPFCALDTDINNWLANKDANRKVGIGDGNYVMVTNGGVGLGSMDTNIRTQTVGGEGIMWGIYRNNASSVAYTGSFDVNIQIPADATIGGTFGDLLDANGTTSGDVNVFINGTDANIHAFPNITVTPGDMNVTVGVNAAGQTITGTEGSACSKTTVTRYLDMPRAMQDGNIADMNCVCNITVKFVDANIAMNNCVNLGVGPTRNYNNNTTKAPGTVGFDVSQMPEFAIDANITMFNVPSSGPMPALTRDGVRCPDTFCKNANVPTRTTISRLDPNSQDVYGVKTWVHNGVTNDGNLFFRVVSFSTYKTGTLDGNISSPAGGENIRRAYSSDMASDGNATFTFFWVDTNEKIRQIEANIYISDNNGGFDTLRIYDNNILADPINNWSNPARGADHRGDVNCSDPDLNTATQNSCTVTFDANGIAGYTLWYIDINLSQDNAGDVDGNYTQFTMDGDKNIRINAPQVRITNATINNGTAAYANDTAGADRAVVDRNVVFELDFNVWLPLGDLNLADDYNNIKIRLDKDTNIYNGWDTNLQDGNRSRHQHLAAVGLGARSRLSGHNKDVDNQYAWDLNLTNYCSYKIGSGTNSMADMNCHFDVNMNFNGAGDKDFNKGEFYIRIDVNTGYDVSAKPIFFDDAKPSAEITKLGSVTRYVKGSAVAIDFNVSDADWYDYNKVEGNFMFADIYYDTDSNYDNSATLIVNDLNLAPRTRCTQDMNDTDRNAAVDANCSYAWDTTGIADGNYWLHIDLNEAGVAAGGAKFGPYGTIATENNVSVSTFVVDNSAPSVSISAPLDGTSTSSATVVVSCSTSDTHSGIKSTQYKVGAAGTWQTSSTLGLADGANSIYCRATNNADTNAEATITITKTTSSGGSGGSGGGGGGGGGGEVTPPTTPTTEIVLTTTNEYSPTAESITEVLTEAGASATAIENASAAVDKTSVIRAVEVVKTTATTGAVSYSSTMTVSVENPGAKKLVDVKVVEKVPKSVAGDASEISSSFAFTVLKADPIIEFTVDEILPGQTATVTYTVAKKVEQSDVDDYGTPVVADFAEKEPCEDVVCDDSNPCTTDSCNATTGICGYTNIADGTSCGIGKECSSGTCTEIAGPAAECTTDADCASGKECKDNACVAKAGAVVAAAVDYTMLGIAAAIIIIIIGAGYYFFIRKK